MDLWEMLLRIWYNIRNFTWAFRRKRRRTRRSLRLMSVQPLPFVNAKESAPYKYAIQELAHTHLTSESYTSLEDKIDAIASIGHLSWTGGIEAAQFTGENFMHIFVLMLKDEDTPDELKVIVKSLSEICCGIRQNQELAREYLLIHAIVDFMAEQDDKEETRKWCLHALFYMLCNNVPNQKHALQHSKYKEYVLRGIEDNWDDWDHNEAQELDTMITVTLKSPPISGSSGATVSRASGASRTS